MPKRILGWSVAFLLFLGAGSFLAVNRVSHGLSPQGSVAIPGLESPVQVLVDSLGVPRVVASSPADAFRAQGYLHARDRLWQMELFQRTARGTLSELFGPMALESDRFLRTLGLREAAEAALASLDAATLELVEAYVEGVNGAVDGWRGALPPEFLLLRVSPSRWDVAMVLSMEKIMAWDLTEYSTKLQLARARSVLDPAGWEVVRPRYPEDGLTILGDLPPGRSVTAVGVGEERGGGEARGEEWFPSSGAALLASLEPPPLAGRLLDAASAVRASNSWVLGGSRTRSGKPIVANDMHLSLNVPALWYLVVLEAPGLRVAGMSLPGAPGVVAGRTDGVAWAFTNAAVDDADLVLERVDPADTTRYLVPGGSEALRFRTELIQVRGLREPDTLLVRTTRNGPVISGVAALPGEELVALRWVGHQAHGTLGTFLAMNRAASVQELLAALPGFTNPHQNVVFADTTGRFGYWMAGGVPLRRNGAPPPLLPVPGWTGEHDWVGFLPFQEHPHLLDPEEGFVVTANNRQGWDPSTALISGGNWASPHRASRIREEILAEALHDLESTHALQMDAVDLFALRHRERAAASFREAGFPEEARRLEAWAGDTSPESREATLFYRWAEAFRLRARSRVYGSGPAPWFPFSALERGIALWEDGAAAEAVEAAREAMSEGEAPPWGEVHRLVLEHPLGEVPVLGSALGFHQGRYPVAGSPFTVNVADFRRSGGEFLVTAGASQRHVSDLSDPRGRGGFILPGGQSGLPRSPHAMDQLPLWLEGGLHFLELRPTDPNAGVARRITLSP